MYNLCDSESGISTTWDWLLSREGAVYATKSFFLKIPLFVAERGRPNECQY